MKEVEVEHDLATHWVLAWANICWNEKNVEGRKRLWKFMGWPRQFCQFAAVGRGYDMAAVRHDCVTRQWKHEPQRDVAGIMSQKVNAWAGGGEMHNRLDWHSGSRWLGQRSARKESSHCMVNGAVVDHEGEP